MVREIPSGKGANGVQTVVTGLPGGTLTVGGGGGGSQGASEGDGSAGGCGGGSTTNSNL